MSLEWNEAHLTVRTQREDNIPVFSFGFELWTMSEQLRSMERETQLAEEGKSATQMHPSYGTPETSTNQRNP